MNLHTTPSTQTQYQQYLRYYWPDLDETLNVGSWEHLEQISTVTVTFVQATYMSRENLSISGISKLLLIRFSPNFYHYCKNDESAVSRLLLRTISKIILFYVPNWSDELRTISKIILFYVPNWSDEQETSYGRFSGLLCPLKMDLVGKMESSLTQRNYSFLRRKWILLAIIFFQIKLNPCQSSCRQSEISRGRRTSRI